MRLTWIWPTAFPWWWNPPSKRSPLLGAIRCFWWLLAVESDAFVLYLLYPVVNERTEDNVFGPELPPLKPRRNRHKVWEDLRWTAARTPIDFFVLKHAIVRIECVTGMIVGIQLVLEQEVFKQTAKTVWMDVSRKKIERVGSFRSV